MSLQIKSENLWCKILTEDIYEDKKLDRQFNLPWILLQAWQKYAMVLIAILALSGVILAFIGYLQYETNFILITYRIFGLFTFGEDPPPELAPAIFLVLLALVLLTGRALVGLFHKRYELLKLHFFKNHVIICGLGDKGIRLVRNFRGDNIPVVVIEVNESNDKIPYAHQLGAIILIGDITDETLLEKAHIEKARYVIAVTDTDDLNMEIAADSFNLIRETPRKTPLRCFAHLLDSELLNTFREHQLFTDTPNFSLKLFNVYENAARLLFHTYPLDNVAETIKETTPPVHLVVIGFNKMGQNVVLQAVKLSSYANGKKIHVTIIDKDIEEEKKVFYRNFRQFDEVCTAYFESIDINDSDQISKIVLEKDERPPISMIIICPENDSTGILCAHSLLPYLRDSRTSKGLKIPMFIHMRFDAGLAVLLQTDPHFVEDQLIQPFGMINKSCTKELVIDDSLSNLARSFHEMHIPKIIHERYLKKQEVEKDPEKIPWEKLPETLKDSNLQQADHIPIKVRAINCDIREIKREKKSSFKFTEEEIELLSRMEHKRWMNERILKGYKYANIETTDNKTKQSPHLVPYDELNKDIKNYDRDAVAHIPEILKKLGMEIYRSEEA
ncbi:MAG: NAD-binding protein [Promethearchaeota archaeon]